MMTSRRQNQRRKNVELDAKTSKQLPGVTSDPNEKLQENVAKSIGPPATRKSKRIRQLKKETSEWVCDLASENEQSSSEDEYAASHASSSDDDDDDEIASISPDQSNSPSDYLQRRSTVKSCANSPSNYSRRSEVRSCAQSGMKFIKSFCKPNSSKTLDIFPNAMKWTFEKMQQLENEFKICHPHMLPNAKNFSKNFEEFNFLKSPSFEITSENQEVIVDSLVLESFGAAPVSKANDELIFCVGGPATALSWCPRSISMVGSKQYLAISTSFGLHSPHRIYKEPTLIQLWNCGVLDIPGHYACTPKVEMKICIHDGPIWELKWCKLGGYLNCEDGLARLGILAAACASGRVLVMSLPDPDSHAEYSEGNTYNVTPDLTLVPCFNDPMEIENLFGQCLCVDWNLRSGGKWLAGGFSKGLVALWKIGQLSSLLQQSLSCEQNEIIACRTFNAHTQPVRSICWCPFQESIFATAGSDCFLKFWNKQSIHSPTLQMTTKVGSVTDMVWPMLWCGVVTSTDEVFARPSASGVLYIDIMTQLQNHTNLIPFKSCCRSVSFSDWMNVCVGVDCTGLTIMYLANFLNRGSNKSRYGRPEPRLISTSLSLKWVSTKDNSEENDKFHLTFCDSDLDNVAGIRQRPCCADAKFFNSVPTAISDKPFVQSANCVSWNPNFGSHTWYCTGFQCGLVRLQSVKALHDSVMDIYKELLEMV